MCGPATMPITRASTPKWPSASTSWAATFSCPTVSGLLASAVERVRNRVSGTVQTKSGLSVTEWRRRPWGVKSSGRTSRVLRVTPGSSVSGSSARRDVSGGSATASGASVAGSSSGTGSNGSVAGSGSGSTAVAFSYRSGNRSSPDQNSRCSARETAVTWAASSSASSSRGVRIRVTAVRTGSVPRRTCRPACVTELPVAFSTLATLAPVSRSTPARNMKTATMCEPTFPSSEDVASCSPSPT
jgi:hypothetical protein